MGGVRVRVLGEFSVDEIAGNRLGSRKGRVLLKMLALARNRPVAVDRLVDAAWPRDPPARPAEQVAVLVSRLRTVLGPDLISRGDAGYALALDWLDVDAAAALVDEAEIRLSSGAVAAARAAAGGALAVLRGPLLPEEADAEWAEPERASAQRLTARAAHTAARAALAAGDAGAAAELAGRALDVDPYDEAALRLLMTAHAFAGRPASALAAYARTSSRLAEDLGVDPAPETSALHGDILRGDLLRGDLPGGDLPGVDLPGGTLHPTPGPARPWDAEDEPGLPGREVALATLDAALEAARAGTGRLVVVDGEAGIGKTALLGTWAAQARIKGALVLSAGCDELGRALPLQPLVDAVDRLVGGLPETEAADVLGADSEVLGPLLGSSPRHASGARLAALTDPGAGQALLFAALFSLLRRQGSRQPVALLLDDVHLAGPATVAWLRQVPARLGTARVAVVATQRPEEGLPLPADMSVNLGPLERSAAARIVGEDRVADLYARSGGNPLFLVELAAAGRGDLPVSIRQAVDERCARAGPAAATLRTAAVIGPDVDLDLLAAVSGVPPAELLDHLEEGVRRLILVERGPSFGFRHALVREAVAATASGSRRAYIHREAGRALNARPGADPLVVAHHARLAGDSEPAAAALLRGARLALGRFSQDEAVRLLDDAIALHDTAEARLERARIHSMQGRFDEGDADVRVARAIGAGAEALEVAAWTAHFRREFDKARTLADRGALEASDAEVRVSCLGLSGWSSLAAGDLASAETRLASAMAEATGAAGATGAPARAAPPAGSRLLPSVWLGFLRLNQGRNSEALILLRPGEGEGLAAYRFPNGYSGLASALALGMLGRAGEALATLDVLDRDIERMGARRWAPRAANVRGWILRNLGAAAQADDLNVRGVETAAEVALDEGVANGELDLAAGRLASGDLDSAVSHLDRADRVSGQQHAFRWRHVLRSRLLRARLALAAGDPALAEELAASLVADTLELGALRYEVQARLVVAVSRAGSTMPPDVESVAALLGRLPSLAGLEAWWLTADVADAFGIDRWRALAHRRVGDLVARAGDQADALRRIASRRLG